MNSIKKYDKFPVALAILLFFTAGAINIIDDFFPVYSTLFFFVKSGIYSLVILMWLIHVQKYILSDKIRKILTILSILLLFYMLLRAAKYEYIKNNDYCIRILWYLYYIPQIFIPFLTLCVAVRIGKSEDYTLPVIFKILFLSGIILELLILTNDIHFLAFRFNPGFYNWETEYSRGPVYVITAIWIYLMLFTSVAFMTNKCKVINRKKSWIPVSWLFVGSVYIVLISYVPILSEIKPFNLPETECFIIVAMLESCIRIGMIPSNTRYAEFFRNATFSVQIADKKNKVIYKSQSAAAITYDQMTEAKLKPLYLDEDTLLLSESVCGGNIYWTTDLSAVNRMNEELHDSGESLYEKNMLLLKENEIKEEKTKISEKNRLYDNIALLVKPQLDKISGFLTDEKIFVDNIPEICVLNCYIKRRANLTLLADSKSETDIYELYISIRESLEYMKLKNIVGNISLKGSGSAPSDFILCAFDLWENEAEQLSNRINAILVSLFWNDARLILRISTETDSVIQFNNDIISAINKLGGCLTCINENGTVFTELTIVKGGETE